MFPKGIEGHMYSKCPTNFSQNNEKRSTVTKHQRLALPQVLQLKCSACNMLIKLLLSAQEYVESLEGCEGLVDRLAHPSQTGQDEVRVQ